MTIGWALLVLANGCGRHVCSLAWGHHQGRRCRVGAGSGWAAGGVNTHDGTDLAMHYGAGHREKDSRDDPVAGQCELAWQGCCHEQRDTGIWQDQEFGNGRVTQEGCGRSTTGQCVVGMHPGASGVRKGSGSGIDCGAELTTGAVLVLDALAGAGG